MAMMQFTDEETDMLLNDNYTPGFIGDIQEGDLVAIPPVSRISFDGTPILVKTLQVIRVVPQDAGYHDPDEDRFIPNVVVSFIGVDVNNRPQHEAYGHLYPCFIKRNSE